MSKSSTHELLDNLGDGHDKEVLRWRDNLTPMIIFNEVSCNVVG
jgi:hypothetical protein